MFSFRCRHRALESGDEKGFRAVQDVQGFASLPGFDFTNDCLKCWFRPCLTHWKNSAMKTTLVVKIQLCPFIWHLQWSTLLIGWVNKATIAMNEDEDDEHYTVKSLFIWLFAICAHAHSANVRLEVFVFDNWVKQVMMARVQSSSNEYTVKGKLCGYRMLQVLYGHKYNM